MAHLYSELATRLAQSIEKGIFKPGDRLPGVRAASRNEGVSPSTVVAAYHHLETEGYIAARPRSGFYVRSRYQTALAEPKTRVPAAVPRPVTGQELVLQLIQSLNTPGIVQLGANLADASLLPAAALSRAMAAVARHDRRESCRYQVPPGLPALRSHIARRMVESGCLVDPENIVITTGCQEAIYLALKSVTSPGDVVALESPTYYGLLQAVDSLGLKALEIPTDPREGMSVEALELALEQWPVKACVVIPNFSNPLGAVMPDRRKRELVELVNRHPGVTLIEDDIYGDLYFEGSRPCALKSLETQDNIIHCASLSKSVSAGLRIGWAVSARHYQRLCYEKLVASCATSSINQLTTTRFLDSGGIDRHLRALRVHLAQNTYRMIERVGKYFPASTRVTRPTGGMTLWLELERAVDTTALAQAALERGISIAPGEIFSSTPGKYKNCLRLNCAVAWSNEIERALETLGELVLS
jgi:DNA-binding transcriptional MocR family regulator